MLGPAKLLLAPVLLWQGRQVRRRALQLPEADGARAGQAGEGALKLRLLIVGDSSGAGVGAPTQDLALAGRLAAHLAQALGGRVHWQLVARTGHDSADARQHLAQAALQPADVLVTALGVNDVVGQRRPSHCLRDLDAIHQLAVQRCGVRYSLHSAVPPMHAFPLLPQPLRWMLGAQSQRLNRRLARHLMGRRDRGLQSLPSHLHGPAAAQHMAEDGFHPGPAGYEVWAQALSQRLVRERKVWSPAD